MCSLDLESCQVWREETRKARKTHACDTCAATIRPGDMYVSHGSLYDGSWTAEKSCAACDADRSRFGREHHGKPIPSYFPEALRECIAGVEGEKEVRDWVDALEAILSRQRAAREART